MHVPMILKFELERRKRVKEGRRRGRDTGVWDGWKMRSRGAKAKSQ